MGEVIWVEVLSRHRDVVSRHRCAGPVVHVGRGYANDVVLDDPHVAAQHLRIARQPDGHWIAEDLGSLNGLHVKGQPQSSARLSLDDEEPFRIGNTWLRVRTSAQMVAPERPLAEVRRLWPLAAPLAVLVGLASLLQAWLEQTDRPRWGHDLTHALGLVSVVLAWSGAWAIVSRVFSGAPRYALHVCIASAAILTLGAYGHAVNVLSYALSWGGLASGSYVGVALIAAAACLGHLLAIAPRHAGLKAGAMLGLAVLGIAVQGVSRTDLREMLGPNTVVRTLEPPALRLARPHSADVFFAADADLKAQLDKARVSEPPPSAAQIDEDDDE